MQKEILSDLGFINNYGIQWKWHWNKYFFVSNGKDNTKPDNRKTTISRVVDLITTKDYRECILYHGKYIFDDKEFAEKLLLYVGVVEKIKNQIILDTTPEIGHRWFLEEKEFEEIEPNWWVNGMYSVTIVPPAYDNDRGKCIILRRSNIKRLKREFVPATVCYKGRYFFENVNFTYALFEHITFFIFFNGRRNKDYKFERELWYDNKFLDVELLKF